MDGTPETPDTSVSEQASTPSDSNDPEALVRKDNKAVGLFRLLVVGILGASAIATSLSVFRYTRNAEEKAYTASLNNIGLNLRDGFYAETRAKVWMASTIATAIRIGMRDESPATYVFKDLDFHSLASEALLFVNSVSWSPFLSTEEEREMFELAAQSRVTTIGPYPPCFMCGSENQTFNNPTDLIDFPGYRPTPCGSYDVPGRIGIYAPPVCEELTAVALTSCECEEVPPGVQMPTNIADIPDFVYEYNIANELTPVPDNTFPYSPIAQATALFSLDSPAMFNLMSIETQEEAILQMQSSGSPAMSKAFFLTDEYYYTRLADSPKPAVASVLYFPVFSEDEKLLGSVVFDMSWDTYYAAQFPEDAELVDIFIENTCGQIMKFRRAEFLGFEFVSMVDELPIDDEDHFSSSYSIFELLLQSASPATAGFWPEEMCRYKIHIYGTDALRDKYISDEPLVYSLTCVFIFLFCAVIFFGFDFIVHRRQAKVMRTAKRANDIVVSLFPKTFRDRIYRQQQQSDVPNSAEEQNTAVLDSFLSSGQLQTEDTEATDPMADLFPSATVMYLDICNFTAWSSERDASQVFRLLETLFQAFDEIGSTLGIFKVETIGDCYVAVCGLPERKEDHAVVMAIYAQQCLKRMVRALKDLEVHLGPSTGDLRARVGLHSGPVTAGVLRGEKARFQLFGDTVNVAYRMENTGVPHAIHCTRTTADLIRQAGKETWVKERDSTVRVKGKGEIQTYWITPSKKDMSRPDTSINTSSLDDSNGSEVDFTSQRIERLVDWNVEVMSTLLGKVMADRLARKVRADDEGIAALEQKYVIPASKDFSVIDEMKDVLEMPPFASLQSDIASVRLEKEVLGQLRKFIQHIASLYKDVAFHNFEHASHVLLSSSKLLKRIVNPEDIDKSAAAHLVTKEAYDLTYGISGDPMLHFAMAFSALVIDVDHSGLSNSELTAEEKVVSLAYRGRSVAEQNSIDVAWMVLMDDQFQALRSSIYTNKDELIRFRQLTVNAVMATDLADEKLADQRQRRWEEAFSPSTDVDSQECINCKATIVFESIIQASDICHTMQHWQNYRKFNTRYFEERYVAWLSGVLKEEPSSDWYERELRLFDHYVIPMAEKLSRCGVFGVSYHEALSYAQENRSVWQTKGRNIVRTMLADMQAKYPDQLPQRCPRKA